MSYILHYILHLALFQYCPLILQVDLQADLQLDLHVDLQVILQGTLILQLNLQLDLHLDLHTNLQDTGHRGSRSVTLFQTPVVTELKQRSQIIHRSESQKNTNLINTDLRVNYTFRQSCV